MVINTKRKGNDFERQAVEILNKIINSSVWKRVPSSGAIGTNLDEPLLLGDINGKVDNIPFTFKAEAKTGYGGEKQFTLKKIWLDKIKEESEKTKSFPFLIGKFSGAKNGVKVFVVLSVEDFSYLINEIQKLKMEK